MSWNARLRSGVVIRQRDNVSFFDVDLYSIEEMWLDGLENAAINRRFCPGFKEFIQFNVAYITPQGARMAGEFIGWTNGEKEFVIGVTDENHSFHPDSKCKR